MRALLLPCVLLLCVGCVDVEHAIVRTDDDAVAYRARLTPHQPVPEAAAALADLLPGLTQDHVRCWQDDQDRWVLQARFASPAGYEAYTQLALETIAQHLGPVAERLRPPHLGLDHETGAWLIDEVVPGGTGSWSLSLGGPSVVGKSDRRILGGHRVWESAPGQPDRRVTATLTSGRPQGMAAFLIQSGPSLLCAFAGLGLLVWVNRRTRRRAVAGAT